MTINKVFQLHYLTFAVLLFGTMQLGLAADSPSGNPNWAYSDSTVFLPNSIRLIKVILIPPGMTTENSQFDEQHMQKIGCTFMTIDPSHIARFINLIRNAGLNTAPVSDNFNEDELQERIYLTLNDGTTAKLLLGRINSNLNVVEGLYISPPVYVHEKMISIIRERFITANPSLLQELFFWSSEIGRATSKGTSKDQFECDQFMEQVDFFKALLKSTP